MHSFDATSSTVLYVTSPLNLKNDEKKLKDLSGLGFYLEKPVYYFREICRQNGDIVLKEWKNDSTSAIFNVNKECIPL